MEKITKHMTKAKFVAFEKVRRSGLARIHDINEVIFVGFKYGQILSKEECIDCLMNYDKYVQKYLIDKRIWKRKQ
jgi:hypothetical protein